MTKTHTRHIPTHNCNPHDLVMRACISGLGVKGPEFVGVSMFKLYMHAFLQQTQATRGQLVDAIRKFPQTLPPPVTDMTACVRLAFDIRAKHGFGDPGARTDLSEAADTRIRVLKSIAQWRADEARRRAEQAERSEELEVADLMDKRYGVSPNLLVRKAQPTSEEQPDA